MCNLESRLGILARTNGGCLLAIASRYALHAGLPLQTGEYAPLLAQVANVPLSPRKPDCTLQLPKRGRRLVRGADELALENRNAQKDQQLQVPPLALREIALAPGILTIRVRLLQHPSRIQCDEDSIQPSHAAAESIHHAKRTSR